MGIIKWVKDYLDDYYFKKNQTYIKETIAFYRDDGRVIYLTFELRDIDSVFHSEVSYNKHYFVDVEIEDRIEMGYSCTTLNTHLENIEYEIYNEYMDHLHMPVRQIIRKMKDFQTYMTFEALSDYCHFMHRKRAFGLKEDWYSWK